MTQRGLSIDLHLIRINKIKAVAAWFGCYDSHGSRILIYVDQADSWDHDLFIFSDGPGSAQSPNLPRDPPDYQHIYRRNHEKLQSSEWNITASQMDSLPISPASSFTMHVLRTPPMLPPMVSTFDTFEFRDVPYGWKFCRLLGTRRTYDARRTYRLEDVHSGRLALEPVDRSNRGKRILLLLRWYPPQPDMHACATIFIRRTRELDEVKRNQDLHWRERLPGDVVPVTSWDEWHYKDSTSMNIDSIEYSVGVSPCTKWVDSRFVINISDSRKAAS